MYWPIKIAGNKPSTICCFLPGAPTSQEEAAVQEPEVPAGVPKKGLKLSYDEYKQMANLMVLYMRKQEEESGGE